MTFLSAISVALGEVGGSGSLTLGWRSHRSRDGEKLKKVRSEQGHGLLEMLLEKGFLEAGDCRVTGKEERQPVETGEGPGIVAHSQSILEPREWAWERRSLSLFLGLKHGR